MKLDKGPQVSHILLNKCDRPCSSAGVSLHRASSKAIMPHNAAPLIRHFFLATLYVFSVSHSFSVKNLILGSETLLPQGFFLT